MKKNSTQILCAGLAVLAMNAQAAYVDITVNDGSFAATGKADTTYGSGDPRGISESGETEHNTVTGHEWDLRAFAYDSATSHLMVVSGFNPLTDLPGTGVNNPMTGNNRIFLGDIFIDTNNAFTLPAHGSNTYIAYPNSAVGFEYAINLTDPVGGLNFGYDVVQLGSTSTFQSGGYAQNAHSDPANLLTVGNGNVVSSGLFSVTTKTDAQVLTDLGINVGTNGGTNYVFTFDLSAASLASGATFRLTETCGNDLLVGQLAASPVVAVPETSTWVMGFLALGAVGFMIRRSGKTAA